MGILGDEHAHAGDAASRQAALPVLVNVSVAGCRPFAALLAKHRVLALAHWAEQADVPLRGAGSIDALLREWRCNAPLLQALCEDPATPAAIARFGADAASLRWHAPLAPRQIHCTIGNYRCQLLEAALDADDGPSGPGAPDRRAAALAALELRRHGGEPYVCLKSSAALTGPYEPLPVPPEHATLDWEVEIGVVIGRPASRVSVEQALEHVAGYCVVNDLTLRERVFRAEPKRLGTDWLQSKGGAGWLPAGPWLVPAWQVQDPASLRLWLKLNGRTMQDGSASEMLFSVAEQIAYLSRHTRLEAGDLLCTGSPAGFGSHHGRYLRAGDVVEAGIDGLGVLRTQCEASPTAEAWQ